MLSRIEISPDKTDNVEKTVSTITNILMNQEYIISMFKDCEGVVVIEFEYNIPSMATHKLKWEKIDE